MNNLKCTPFVSLQEVNSWLPGSNPLWVAKEPFRACKCDATQRPKTLICHDLGGNYKEDSFVQGSADTDVYTLYHWNIVDIFVYFSHSFVTLPPPTWTNAAHRHGVKCLGTVITEGWIDGTSLCQRFLESREVAEQFANKLVEIASYYNFDGWLFNIENALNSAQVQLLVHLLRYLGAELHRRIPHGLLLWYDSVIVEGALDWQNELNNLNQLFFSSTDGIFLNYTWNRENLSKTRDFAASRVCDVYVGIDVWGRGQFGGGGFNTNLALEVVREFGLSAAIFAPAWTFEKLGYEQFEINNNFFWSMLLPLCYTHRVERSSFATSFCKGSGKRLYWNGIVIHPRPWFHLSLQQIQPVSYGISSDGQADITFCAVDGFCGGGCLQIRGTTCPGNPANIALFTSSISCRPPFLVVYTFKALLLDSVHFALEIHTRKTVPFRNNVFQLPALNGNGDSDQNIYSTLTDDDSWLQQAAKLDKSLSSSFLKTSGWTTRVFLIRKDVGDITDISVLIKPTENREVPFWLLFGQLKIFAAEDLYRQLPVSEYLVKNVSVRKVEKTFHTKANPYNSDMTSWNSLDLTLEWTYSVENFDHFRVYQIDSTHRTSHLLGFAHTCMFEVVKLYIPDDCQRVTFVVQPVCHLLLAVPLQDCTGIDVDLTSDKVARL